MALQIAMIHDTPRVRQRPSQGEDCAAVLSLLRRRPCTFEELAHRLAARPVAILRCLDQRIDHKQIETTRLGDLFYYGAQKKAAADCQHAGILQGRAAVRHGELQRTVLGEICHTDVQPLVRNHVTWFSGCPFADGTPVARGNVMRIAIPICDGRISPVFDVARRLIVVDVDDRGELSRTERTLDHTEISVPARRIADLGLDVLICGAMSLSLEKMLPAADVEVVGRTCGEAGQVLCALFDGTMTEQSFLMPGCSHRRRLRTRRGRHNAPNNEKGRDEP